MRWRLVRLEDHRAAMNMAIDEAVSEGIRDGSSPPTLRLYRWQPSAVSIGCFQSLRDEVDVAECHRRDVDIVRRRTGGGAVFHDHNGEITYSIIAPQHLLGPDLTASYREVCGWVMDALKELGMDPEYRPINDITVGGKKISGCAQTRREGVFLQHGTVLHALDRALMFSLLKTSVVKTSDKGITDPWAGVTSVAEQSEATMSDLYKALQRSFCQGKEWIEQSLTASELSRASQLARDRYDDPAWTASR